MTDSYFVDPGQEDKGDILPPSPFAKYAGLLKMGSVSVEVYVLDTGDRIMSKRGAVHALTGADHGKLDDFLDVKPLQPFLEAAKTAGENRGSKETNPLKDRAKTAGEIAAENKGSDAVTALKYKAKTAAENLSFFVPGAGWAQGITAERFEEIITAYVTALNAGALKTDRQREIAMRCAVMGTAYLRLGIIAAIDEATGYQHVREQDALQVTLQAYVSPHFRDWQKLFPDELWEQFGRLTKWGGPLHSRPKWWGHLVNALIYDTLEPTVSEYLRANKPSPRLGVAYHQWLTADFGARKLLEHIHQIIGIAKGCDSLWELKDKVALAFGSGPAQRTMYLPGAR